MERNHGMEKLEAQEGCQSSKNGDGMTIPKKQEKQNLCSFKKKIKISMVSHHSESFFLKRLYYLKRLWANNRHAFHYQSLSGITQFEIGSEACVNFLSSGLKGKFPALAKHCRCQAGQPSLQLGRVQVVFSKRGCGGIFSSLCSGSLLNRKRVCPSPWIQGAFVTASSHRALWE